MELLQEIYEEEVGYENANAEVSYKVRKASRAIIFNNDNQIALLFVSKNNYHKLPGGGIEKGENIAEALTREVMEEVGVQIKVSSEVGTVIEYRNQFSQLQISYCFLGKVTSTLSKPSFTDDELSAGFKLKWVELDKAIELLEKDEPNNYVGKFIQKRDLCFLLSTKK